MGKWRVDLEPDKVEFGMGVIAVGGPLRFLDALIFEAILGYTKKTDSQACFLPPYFK